MKKILFVAIAMLATACASTSDVVNLQDQVNSLSVQVKTAAADAASAKVMATEAAIKADAAEVAASQAAASALEVNEKLDRMFQQTQYK